MSEIPCSPRTRRREALQARAYDDRRAISRFDLEAGLEGALTNVAIQHGFRQRPTPSPRFSRFLGA